MPEKYAVIRLTLKVDMNDKKEIAFCRAMLRRLNILFAKCRPKGTLAELLNGSKLSDAYEGKVDIKQPKPEKHKYLAYRVTKTEKPKIEAIVEQSMQPPEIVEEIS